MHWDIIKVKPLKIPVKYLDSSERLYVRHNKGLYGSVSQFIDSLHRAQRFDSVLLKGGKIVQIGGVELTKGQEVRSWVKQVQIKSPF